MAPHTAGALSLADLINRVGVPVVIALGFGFARAAGLIVILPIFTRLQLGTTLRVAVAIVIALIVTPAISVQFASLPRVPMPLILIIMLIKEGMLGVILGVVMAVPFWAAETAGEFIDQQRGSQGAIVPTGNQPEQAGILGTLMILVFTMTFLRFGGFDLVLRGYVASYVVWPAFASWPSFSAGAAIAVLRLLDSVTRIGLILAAPLVVAMLVAELSLGLINRFAQQFNVFDISLSVKNLIVLVGLCLYLLTLLHVFRGLIANILHVGSRLEGTVGALHGG